MNSFTVLGSKGFIGSYLVKDLLKSGYSVNTSINRNASCKQEGNGHVLYCIGLTADFRKRPIDTVEAHVGNLLQYLQIKNYKVLVYLSSTRMYRNNMNGKEESSFNVNPQNGECLYDISKIMGESICLNCGHDNIKVARISNVVGDGKFQSPSFIPMIIEQALLRRHIILNTSLNSCKDYVYIHDVVNILKKIAQVDGGEKIINVASGKNITNGEIIERICSLTGSTYEVADNPQMIQDPIISTQIITERFNFKPVNILDVLPEVIQNMRVRK